MSSEPEALQSECDHIMGECYTGMGTGSELIYSYSAAFIRIYGQSSTFTRFNYCPLCGTKLAPIFKAMEAIK